MTSADMRKLEVELNKDLLNQDAAVRARVRDLVKAFLLDEIREVTGKRVKHEDEILELVRINAHRAILQQLIEKPSSFTPKDLKELLKSGETDEPVGKVLDPITAMANDSRLDPAEKAKVVAALADLARANIKKRALDK